MRFWRGRAKWASARGRKESITDRLLATQSSRLCYHFNRQATEDMLSIRLSLLGNLLLSNEGFC